jgi:hypothetical protein
MTRFTSRLPVAAFCVVILGMAVGAGLRLHESAADETAARRALTEYFLVERLPASVRDLECQDFADSCDPDNPTTICFVRIEPRDFELLARQAHFRKNEDTCPENFSNTYQMGLPVGPDFKINEEHWGGTDEAQVAVYPDAAHSRFIAVLSRPSRLTCLMPATTASVVRQRLR